MADKSITERKGQTSGLGLVGLAAALWGTGGATAKQLLAVSELDPIEIGFYRLAISAPALLAAGVLLNKTFTLNLDVGHRWLVVALALATALYQLFYYNAVAKAGVTMATLITICMAPPIVAISSNWFLGERIDNRTKLAMAVALTGTVLLTGWPAKAMTLSGNLLLGSALALCAAVSYASMVLVSRQLAQVYNAYQLIVLGFGGGALLLLPIVTFEGFDSLATVEALGLLGFLGLVPTAIAYVFFFIGMQRAPATAASVVSLLEPLVAAMLGILIFHERISLVGSIGAALMISGLLILRERSSKEGREN